MAKHRAFGPLSVPRPAMPGAHQADNAALAVAMLRHQDKVPVAREGMAKGILAARWPARSRSSRTATPG